MTASELKRNVENTGSCFFTRSSMRFFGDTMSNYGVSSYKSGNQEAWELHRKRPVKMGMQNSAFFDKETFERIHSIEE